MTTITGTGVLPDGTLYASAVFRFVRNPVAVEAQDGQVVTPKAVTTQSNASGAVSFSLLPGNYVGTETSTNTSFAFTVPDAASADWANCVAAASAPSTADFPSSGVTMTGGGTAQDYAGFATRAAFVAWANGKTPAVGTVIYAAGFGYRYIGSGTAIADLPGWKWNINAYPDHWAENVTPGTTDMGPAIQSAMDSARTVYLANAVYATGQELQGTRVRIFGANNGGNPSTLLGLSASMAVGEAILALAGRSNISDLVIGYDAITKTEGRWERVGLRPNFGGDMLNRGASCERLQFDLVGTAISDFGASEFSVTYNTMDIRRHSFAGVDISGGGTGSVWDNIYINHNGDPTLSATYGFNMEKSNGVCVRVLNVEHSDYSVAAVRFAGCVMRVESLHLEGVDCTASDHGYIEVDGGNVSFGYCHVQQTRMTQNNTSIFRLYRAGGAIGDTMPVEFLTQTRLSIDVLNLISIAAPGADRHPTYRTDYPTRIGVANCPGYVVFRRDAAFTDTDFTVEVRDIMGGPYNETGTADRDYYKDPDYKAAGSLVFRQFVSRSRMGSGETLLRNGYFDKWRATSRVLTSNVTEIADGWVYSNTSGSTTISRVDNELGAEGAYALNLNVTAGTFQALYQDFPAPAEIIDETLELSWEMKAATAGTVFNQLTVALTNTGGTPASASQQIAASSNQNTQAKTVWTRHTLTFDCLTGTTVSAWGPSPYIRLKFAINDGSATYAPNLTIRNITLRRVKKLGPARHAADRLALTMRDVAGAETHGAMFWRPRHNTVTLDTMGLAAPTVLGAATAAAIATTNAQTIANRIEYLQTVASTTAIAGFYGTERVCTNGGVLETTGGYRFIGRWGPATGVTVTTHRAFFGLANAIGAATDVEPSTLPSCLGMAWDAADANIQFMHNDSGGTCTKLDLGSNFPVPTVDRTDMYELRLESPRGTDVRAFWEVKNLTNGATANGIVTSNMPGATTLLAPRGWMSAGGTSSTPGIAFGAVIISPAV